VTVSRRLFSVFGPIPCTSDRYESLAARTSIGVVISWARRLAAVCSPIPLTLVNSTGAKQPGSSICSISFRAAILKVVLVFSRAYESRLMAIADCMAVAGETDSPVPSSVSVSDSSAGETVA
jgi:hypothetical protein